MNGISVIMCCHNSSKRLLKTIDHLLKQEVSENLPWEVIIVDNASTDGTLDTARQILNDRNESGRFSLFSEPRPGKSNALELGFENANYDYLLICDDDNWLDKNYIATSYLIMQERPEVGIAGGFCSPVFESEKPWWIDRFLGGYACELQAQPSHYHHTVYGAGMVMRKSVLDKLKELKYEFLLSSRRGKVMANGEDAEHCKLFALAGFKIWYDSRLALRHFIPSGKLNWAYCKKLFASFGHSSVLLQLYDKALENNAPESLPTFFWLKKYIYFSLLPLRYYPKFREQLKEDVNQDAPITFMSWRLQRKEYGRLRFKLNAAYREIIIVKSRLHPSEKSK